MGKFLRYTAVAFLLLAVASVAAGAYLEPGAVFHPSPADSAWTRKGYEAVEQDRTRALVEDVWLTTADGVRIHGWFMSPRKRAERLPVVLWFHGNAGNVGKWLTAYERVVALRAHVLALDYRGYGRSEGEPSEAGLYADADAAWEYLTQQRGFPPGRIFIYGYSLGGGVAVDLASRVDAAGLVVQSSFTSVPDVAHRLYPLIPRWLVWTEMDSLSKITRVRCPKLFIHGTGDMLIPYRMGQELFAAASGPKEFVTVQGAGHSRTFEAGGERLLRALDQLLNTASSAD